MGDLLESLRRNVEDPERWWRERYIHDFGVTGMMDDLSSRYTWEQRYRFRQSMNRLWRYNGVTPDLVMTGVEYITSFGNSIATINTEGTVDITGQHNTVHYDVRAIKLVGLSESLFYILSDNGLYASLSGGPLVDTGLTRIVDIMPRYIGTPHLASIDADHNLVLISGPTIMDTGLKVRSYSGGYGLMAVVDIDHNVWYTTDVDAGRLQDATWVQIPNIKAKQVDVGEMCMIITDIDGRLWGYGDNRHGSLGIGDVPGTNIPIPLNIIGRHVYMDRTKTIVIDNDNNVWRFGSGQVMIPGFKGIGGDIDPSAGDVYLIGNYLPF